MPYGITLFAYVGHFHYFVLTCSVCFNNVIFSAQILLEGLYKSTRQLQIEIKPYNFFITPIKVEMCDECLGAKAHLGGFSIASVSSTSAGSFHAAGFIPV